MQRIQIIIIIIASLILLLVIGAGFLSNYAKGKTSYPYFAILSEVLYLIDKNYVEEVNFGKVEDFIYLGIVKELGGESSFLDNEDIDYYYNPFKKGEGDIGIFISNKEGYIKIAGVRKDSPADKAGIKAGNYIYSIDDYPFYRISIFKAKNLLKGQVGTKVQLKIIEQQGRKPISYDLTREIIKSTDVITKEIDDNIAYINLYDVNKNSYDKLLKSVIEYNNDKINNLIIDLRSCYSDNYDYVKKVASIFLNDNSAVFGLKKKNVKEIIYKAEKGAIKYYGDIYLIIDSSTLKGCEVFAAALIDNARAYAVGAKTYGIAAEQKLINIDKEHALLLDIGLIMRINNKIIQANGVEPNEKYEKAGYDKLRGTIESDDIINKIIEDIKNKRLEKAA